MFLIWFVFDLMLNSAMLHFHKQCCKWAVHSGTGALTTTTTGTFRELISRVHFESTFREFISRVHFESTFREYTYCTESTRLLAIGLVVVVVLFCFVQTRVETPKRQLKPSIAIQNMNARAEISPKSKSKHPCVSQNIKERAKNVHAIISEHLLIIKIRAKYLNTRRT